MRGVDKKKCTFKSLLWPNFCVVLQVSEMAPFLFITGINDLQESIKQCYLYADKKKLQKLSNKKYERKIYGTRWSNWLNKIL